MKVPTFRCPHCGHDLGTAINAHLYGSPLRICGKCKQTYVDRRYHEIALEGIRQEDVNPTEAQKKVHKNNGATFIFIGFGMIALFMVLAVLTGILFIFVPLIGAFCIIAGFGAMKADNPKNLEKTRAALELERRQSELRMQNPEYVQQLRAAGYQIP